MSDPTAAMRSYADGEQARLALQACVETEGQNTNATISIFERSLEISGAQSVAVDNARFDLAELHAQATTIGDEDEARTVVISFPGNKARPEIKLTCDSVEDAASLLRSLRTATGQDAPPTPADKETAEKKELFPEKAPAPTDVEEHHRLSRAAHQRRIFLSIFACVSCSILGGSIYMAGTRNAVVSVILNVAFWLLAQYGPHVFPNAVSKPVWALAYLAFLGMNTGFFLASSQMRAEVDVDPSTLGAYQAFDGFRGLAFNYSIMALSLLFYWQGRGFKHVMSDARKPVPKEERPARCTKDTRRVLIYWAIILAIATPLSEMALSLAKLSSNSLYDALNTIVLIIYFVLAIVEAVGVFLQRKINMEYYLPHYILYLLLEVFAMYIVGRLTSAAITIVRGSDNGQLDQYLPGVFIISKIIFMCLYPFFGAITLRMGQVHQQLKFLFPLQMIDAIILDAFSIISRDLTAFYAVFVLVRVIFIISYQAGVFRWMSDKVGLTERQKQYLILPRNAVDIPADTKSLSAASYAELRQPFGGSPLAQWLFFVQGSMAALMSTLTIMVIVAVDANMAGDCVLTCGVTMGVVQARGAIALGSWAFTTGCVFLILRRKMYRYGFTSSEMWALTADHYRRNVLALMFFGLPVVQYVIDFGAQDVVSLNGAVSKHSGSLVTS